MRHRWSPRTSPATNRSPLSLPAIALLIVSSCVDVAWGNSVMSTSETGRERFDRMLGALTTGSLDERLDTAGNLLDLYRELPAHPEEEDAPTSEEISAAIIDAIAAERDDFVAWSALDLLVYGDDPGLADVFRAALDSDSPNVRSIALRWYADHEDIDSIPLLEELWDGGVPDWARIDLMAALAHHKSSAHLADFLSLTSNADPAVRIAAIAALEELRDDAALPRLLDLARTGDRHVRGPALVAIAEWRESDAAFAAILDASRAGDRQEGTALLLLGTFHRSEGDERLIEALDEQGDLDLRLIAAQALEESSHPAATESIVALLADPGIRKEAQHDVLQILQDRDDAEALSLLQALIDTGEVEDLEPVEKVMTYLRREDRSDSVIITTTTSTSSCEFGFIDPDDPDTWHVVAPNGWRSVRCAEGPAMPAESWLELRIQDGSLVTIRDRFDRAGETWGSIGNHRRTACWVPMSYLERGGGPGERPLDPLALEIDLPAAALETKSARRLIRNGILEPFDADEETVAVVLRPRMDGPSLEELVASIEDGPGADAEDVLELLLVRVEAGMLREVDAPGDSEEED